MLSCDAAQFSIPVRVYYEDTDAGGLVFYVNYLKYMERARTDFLRSLGFENSKIMASLNMFVVTEAQIKYHLAARLDDMLNVTVELDAIGKSRLIFRQCVKYNSGDKVLCSARIVVACVNNVTMKPSALPDGMNMLLSDYAK